MRLVCPIFRFRSISFCEISSREQIGVTHFRTQSFLVIDDAAPSEIKIVVLDANESTRLKERKRVSGVIQHVTEILDENIELLS